MVVVFYSWHRHEPRVLEGVFHVLRRRRRRGIFADTENVQIEVAGNTEGFIRRDANIRKGRGKRAFEIQPF